MTSSEAEIEPPANAASERTANVVYGAPVAEVLANDDKPSETSPAAAPRAQPALAGPLALQRNLAEYAANEAAIASENLITLARSRNVAEFMALYSRFVSEFFNRAARRAINLTDDLGRNRH